VQSSSILIHEKSCRVYSPCCRFSNRSSNRVGRSSSSPRRAKCSRPWWSIPCGAGSRSPRVKAPEFGDCHKVIVEVVAVITGGQLTSEELAFALDKIRLEILDRARRVRIERENTRIVDGASNKEEIQARIRQIKQQTSATAAIA
jgi:hypothetical protein